MQEDKKLQELLQQYAMENVATDFTQNIMQRIEANMAAKQVAKPLLNAKLLRVLGGVFVLVLGVLLILCFKSQFATLPLSSIVALPENYISQLVQFIIVFWVVMLINVFYQQRSKQAA